MRGNVYHRGSKFYIRYDLGKDSNGKRVQKTEGGFDTKRQAERVLRQRITDIENSPSKLVERSLLSAFLKDWLKYQEKRLARNTVQGYKNNIFNHIIPCIGDIPMYKLQPEDVQRLYSNLEEKGLSATSIIYVHRVLHNALQYACKKRILPYNVTDYVDVPIKEKHNFNVLNATQVRTLLSACKDSYIYIPVLLAVSLGLRRGEALGLKWSDIDFERKTIIIQRTVTFYKGGEYVFSKVKTKNSERVLFMSDNLINELLMHKDKQEKDFKESVYFSNYDNLINCRLDGEPIHPAMLDKEYKAIIKKLGFPYVRFHDLRHTNATLMLYERIPAKIVSEMLGHSSIGITLDTYTHVTNEMQLPAVQAIDHLIFEENK